MKLHFAFWGTFLLILAGKPQPILAGPQDKVHEVGKDGLAIQGRIERDDPKVKVIVGDKSAELPGKLFLVKLSAGKKYRIAMDSKEMDSVLVVQNQAGQQLAWDDDSGGGLNALLTLDVIKDGTNKIYAASLEGAGRFTLNVQEAGAVTVHDVGTGLKVQGELGKTQALIYHVKLAAGKTYIIDMVSPEFNAIDPYLRLLDVAGKQLAEDDDGGEGLNARIIYRTAATDTFQIVATCFGKGRGPFTLTVREAQKGDRTLEQQQQLVEATKLNAQAVQLHQQGQYAKAEPLLRRALAIRKEVLGKKHPNYATSLNNLAELYRAQGDYAQAEPLYHQALAITEAVLGNKHHDYAMMLNNLAGLYCAQEDYVKAEPLYRQALAIYEQVVGEKHADYAISLSNFAALYCGQGDYAKAEPLYHQALAITKEVVGEKHHDYAMILNNLAELFRGQGDFTKAEPLYRQALALRKEVLGEKHADYAVSLNNLAELYRAQGDYAKAEPLYLRALAITKEVLGQKHPNYATSLNNLAALYYAQGHYAQAWPLLRQALAISKEKHPDYARGLNNLAMVYEAQGDHAKAESLYRQALTIFKEVLGEKHPRYATSLNNLAALYYAQGDYAQAEPLLRHAQALRKEVLGEKHPEYARSLNNLAKLYEVQGDYAKAEPLLCQALDALQIKEAPVLFGQLQADDLRAHPDTVFILRNYTLLLVQRASKTPTTDHFRSCDHGLSLALAVLERVRQHNLDREASKIQLTGEHFDLFADRIRVLARLFTQDQKLQDLEAAFQTAEQGTSRVFLEAIGKTRANILAGVSPKMQAQEQKLLLEIRLLDRRIDKESARPLDKRNAELVGKLLQDRNAAETQLKELVAQMEKEHPQYAALKYPRPCTLEEARACLQADEVALLFVPGTETTCLVLIEKQPKKGAKSNGIAIFELPGSEALAEQVAALNDPETLALPARVKALARQIFAGILGPCQERLQGKHLVIVPGGPLCFLPFGLLVGDDGKYLIEKHRIRYAPSLTALHHIQLWKQKRMQPTVPLFAVGNPVYEEAGKPQSKLDPQHDIFAVSLPGPSRDNPPINVGDKAPDGDVLRDLLWREGKAALFPRLVHSAQEVTKIATLLKADLSVVLTGANASEAKVKAASANGTMAKARYVHFATHGILGLDTGKQPALVLNLFGNIEEDGFLYMDEVTSLKLSADLVVLSACRTGQGWMHRGEGVTGLARGFLYAGSKGVVCSLWSVADRETADLMVDFYGHLQKGQPAAEALREGQLAMIRAGRAPLYWAPFILIGE